VQIAMENYYLKLLTCANLFAPDRNTLSLINYDKKIIKILYFENIRWDKSNYILQGNISIYILVKKYGQSKLCK